MSTATKKRVPVQEAASPMVPRPLHRFTVEQYHRMTEIGVLKATDRVELLNGYIVDKMTQYPPHASTVSRINRLLARVLPETWALRVQAPITLRASEPEPDLAIAVGPEDVYSNRHPLPADLALLIEVADSSLMADRRDKLPIYASERVRACWLVNLVDGRVEVYAKPKGGKTPGYESRRDLGKGATLPLQLGTTCRIELAVSDLLPA